MTSQKTNIFKQQQKSFQSPLLFYMACDIHTVVHSRQIVYVFYNYLFHFIVKPILLLFGFQLVCNIPQLFITGLWIRIRIQEGKFVDKKLTKKCKEIANNCNFIKFFKSKFAQAPLFLTFEQSFMFLQLKKTLHDFFSSNLVKLDLDLDLDPDPHSENCWIRIRVKLMRIHSPGLSW